MRRLDEPFVGTLGDLIKMALAGLLLGASVTRLVTGLADGPACEESYTETTIAASVECKNGALLEVRERAILCVCPKEGA